LRDFADLGVGVTQEEPSSKTLLVFTSFASEIGMQNW